MNLNGLQLLGLALVMLAVGGQALIPGSIVYYSSVAPSASFSPSGTTPNSPFYLQAYGTFTCMALLAGMQTAEVTNATVQISIWTGSVWNVVGTFTLTYVTTSMGILWYEYNFTMGASGNLYALSYLVQTIDVGSFSTVTYIATQTNLGYFCINGIFASNITTMRVSNPTLTFTYTVNASGVSYANFAVFIKVFNGSTQLTQVNLTPPVNGNPPANFTGSYTLPAQGTYTLNGYVTYNSATTQQMSIVAPWGDLSASLSEVSFSDFYLIMTIFGIAFILLGARKKKATEK